MSKISEDGRIGTEYGNDILYLDGYDQDRFIGNLNSKYFTSFKSITDVIDFINTLQGKGKNSTSRELQFYGVNHQNISAHLPPITDFNGYTFFIRPMLNMTELNLINNRFLSSLITKNTKSIPNWTRGVLDPRLLSQTNTENYSCELLDNQQCFIPLLSNNLLTLTGVPDLAARSYTTSPGVYNESFSMIDDNLINYDNYSINTTFRNMNGSPFFILFYSWLMSASQQYLGKLFPYLDDRIAKRLNYTSRVYRFVMDHTRTYITNWWAPVYCYPTSVGIGNVFKFDYKDVYNQDNNEVAVNWQCVGSIVNDPLLLSQFNTTVQFANPEMGDGSRSKNYVKIPKHLLKLFNYNGYPRINMDTMEMEWWVPKAFYEKSKQSINTYQKKYLMLDKETTKDNTNETDYGGTIKEIITNINKNPNVTTVNTNNQSKGTDREMIQRAKEQANVARDTMSVNVDLRNQF